VPQVGDPVSSRSAAHCSTFFRWAATCAALDLFDRQVDSVRSFDPETQRSGDQFERLELLPAREFSSSADSNRDSAAASGHVLRVT